MSRQPRKGGSGPERIIQWVCPKLARNQKEKAYCEKGWDDQRWGFHTADLRKEKEWAKARQVGKKTHERESRLEGHSKQKDPERDVWTKCCVLAEGDYIVGSRIKEKRGGGP